MGGRRERPPKGASVAARDAHGRYGPIGGRRENLHQSTVLFPPLLLAASDWINVAVAIGTLGATSVAVYELHAARVERRRSETRELAERLYVPALRDIRHYLVSRGDTTGYSSLKPATFTALQDFRAKQPHLLRLVPRHVIAALEPLESAYEKLRWLRNRVYKAHERVARSVIAERLPLAKSSRSDEIILRTQNSQVANTQSMSLWLARSDIASWLDRELRRHDERREDARVILRVGDVEVEGEEARTYYRAVDDALNKEAAAVDFRAAQDEFERACAYAGGVLEAEIGTG